MQCILENTTRLKPEYVISILVDILVNKKFNLGRKICDILIRIDIREVAQNQLTELHDAILDSISAIIDRGGDPQFIAALENQRPDVFSDLAKVPGNGLVGDQELIYEINKGSNNYTQLYGRYFREGDAV